VGVAKSLPASAPFQVTSDAYPVTSSTIPGYYCWRAAYSGDTNYPSAESTSPENECFFVRQPSTLTTQASNNGTVTAGASITDTATLSIAPLDLATAPDPTGSVTFNLCGPNAAQSTSLNCNPAGSVALVCPASGSTCTATSPAFNVTSSTIPGHYCFNASWPGDTNYTGSSSTTTTNECFFVRQPTLTTTQSSQTGEVVGGSVTDTATISIAPLTSPPAPAPTGTVTFYICGPLASASGCASGTQVGAAKPLSATAPFQATSDPFNASGLAVGFYCWRAVYSGDANYTGSESTSPTNECFFIAPSEGCTPGFWTGGNGSQLWNTVNDPQWAAVIGGVNPFIHTTLFDSFFPDPGSATDGLTMFNSISGGGGSDPVIKAARDLTAAYLNASAGLNYPFTTAQLIAKWNAAIAPGGYSFADFHNEVAPANQLGCPF
jgi:hypothetical protein